MLPRQPRPTKLRCSCGARVKYEKRTTWRGDRWLGVCTNASCGLWTTSLGDGEEDDNALVEFLLDGRPAPANTPPQVRLFLRYAALGWRHHHEGCVACNRRLVMSLDLDPLPNRPADPAHVHVCLDCGYLVVIAWMLDEWHELHVPGEGWQEPAVSVLILKRALEARVTSAMPGRGLDHR